MGEGPLKLKLASLFDLPLKLGSGFDLLLKLTSGPWMLNWPWGGWAEKLDGGGLLGLWLCCP